MQRSILVQSKSSWKFWFRVMCPVEKLEWKSRGNFWRKTLNILTRFGQSAKWAHSLTGRTDALRLRIISQCICLSRTWPAHLRRRKMNYSDNCVVVYELAKPVALSSEPVKWASKGWKRRESNNDNNNNNGFLRAPFVRRCILRNLSYSL